MRISSLLMVLPILVFAATLNAAPTDDLPKPPSFARYEAMMNRSPFAVATAVVAAPVAPNFAKDLYIANAARLTDEGVVTLASSTDKNFKEYLSTKEPNKNGYSVSNIEWSDRVGATKVTIAKEGQFATLTFNQSLLAQPMANPGVQQPFQPQINPGFPVAPGAVGNVNAIRPAPIPTLPTPPPRVRGVIQRSGGVQPPPQPPEPQQGVIPDG